MTKPIQQRTYDNLLNEAFGRIRVLEALPEQDIPAQIWGDWAMVQSDTGTEVVPAGGELIVPWASFQRTSDAWQTETNTAGDEELRLSENGVMVVMSSAQLRDATCTTASAQTAAWTFLQFRNSDASAAYGAGINDYTVSAATDDNRWATFGVSVKRSDMTYTSARLRITNTTGANLCLELAYMVAYNIPNLGVVSTVY